MCWDHPLKSETTGGLRLLRCIDLLSLSCIEEPAALMNGVGIGFKLRYALRTDGQKLCTLHKRRCFAVRTHRLSVRNFHIF